MKVNAAAGMRARSLLRRYVWATVGLGVFAGIAGGAALGAWGVARRTSTVYDRFVAYEDASTLTVFACHEGVEPGPGYIELCGDYDFTDMRDFLDTVPGFSSAGRATAAMVGFARADDPSAHTRILVQFPIDPGGVPGMGRPIVVDGRLADPAAASEVVINEESARRAQLGVGDQFVITPYRISEFDIAAEGVQPPTGEPMTMTVTGIVRRPGDLVGGVAGTVDNDFTVVPGPAWWSAVGGDVANYGTGLLITTEPGTTDESIVEAITERWPDRPMQIDSGSLSSAEDQQTVVDAIRLQAFGLELVAIAVALAGVVFAGQALARQARREWEDASVLDALGMSRSTMASAAALRAGASVAVALVVSAVVCLAVSPLGPIGIGRAAETDPGVVVDAVVLVVGLPVLGLAVLACSVVPVLSLRRRPGSVHIGRSRASGLVGSLPPAGVAGWAMTSTRRAGGVALGSAVVGVALAAAAGIAAWSLVASYDDLVARPDRFGSTWDALVANVGDESQEDETRAKLDAISGIRSVGLKSVTGLFISDDATVIAGEPFLGDVAFGAITDGRGPVAEDEVALGHATLDELGVGIGDTATLTDVIDPTISHEFEVVGEVVLNDGLSAQPGEGALVTVDAFDEMAPDNLSQTYAVWIDEDADRQATLDALRSAFPTTFVADPEPPSAVRNLGLLADQPALIALLVGVLAGAALVHALVSSVRRGRRQIGVLKTLGFTRAQVSGSVAWHATTLAGAALIIGIPLGIVAGRVAWTAIADELGLVSPPVLPVAAIGVIAALVLAVANLAALGPGLVAGRTRPASALRSE